MNGKKPWWLLGLPLFEAFPANGFDAPEEHPAANQITKLTDGVLKLRIEWLMQNPPLSAERHRHVVRRSVVQHCQCKATGIVITRGFNVHGSPTVTV